MNKDQIEGNWEEFKGKAKQQWAKLGDTDYKLLFEGKVQEFAGKAQQAYGKNEEDFKKDLESFDKANNYSYSRKFNKAA
jgi:uncharacterized protein YjbJ (UPF0337 family)